MSQLCNELPEKIRDGIHAFGENGEHRLTTLAVLETLGRFGAVDTTLYAGAYIEQVFAWAYRRYHTVDAARASARVVGDVTSFRLRGELPYYVKRIALACIRQEVEPEKASA